MSEELAVYEPESRIIPVAEVKAQMAAIDQLLKHVMVRDVHYGVPPGMAQKDKNGKPTRPMLFLPGAEKLLLTFQLAAAEPRIEDLSVGGEIRYRVTRPIANRNTGVVVAVGIGTASSEENKWAWRTPSPKEEWDDTPENLRREVWRRKDGVSYKQKQVHTKAADLDNTILKMADKRALIQGVLRATGASDLFDTPDEPKEVAAVAGAEVEPEGFTEPQELERSEEQGGDKEPPKAKIVKVEEVNGTSKEGKAWVKWVIAFDNGSKFGTFDTAVRDSAKKFQLANKPVYIVTETKGKFTNLIELVEVPE